MSDPAFGIYVHWPYCARICPYCDFNVYRARGDSGAAILLEAIERDIAAHAELIGRRKVDTLFFGGGTPSLLGGAEIAHLIAVVSDAFGFEAAPEITLECNPEDKSRFADHAAAGVNRFSLGVQALDDAALRALGRRHDVAAARAAIEAAARTDQRASIDMIYARQGQSLAAWARELRAALTLPIEHLSLYQLTIEDGTAFARAAARGSLKKPNNESAAGLYETTQELCEAAGFPAYEISNHARGPGAQSGHNLLYWRGGDWIGVGPGAHGRFMHSGRLATEAARTPADYIAQVNAGGKGWRESPALTDREAATEALLMGLRLTEGLARSRLAAHPPQEARIATLMEEGVLIASPERLTLTPRGRLLADRVAAMLAD